MCIIPFAFLLGFVEYGHSQSIKGYVYLTDNNNALVNAEINVILNGRQIINTITDDKGFFELILNKPGIYTLSVFFETYANTVNLEVDEHTILNADIYLEPIHFELAGVNIFEEMYQLGNLTMTQSQFRTMPASFQDPSRIIIRYPGFSTANDGANSIVYRGLPPESARWQLYGADIVNPNHLSNAGTSNDLATINSGGVNAINGNVLDYYHFEANPVEASYNNVLSGVSNLKMANALKSYIDLNLIGLEAGVGSNVGNKNFYASYRYSFTGLLNQFGVDFGNEKIGYQDISLYSDLIKNENNHLKIFATLGKSHNRFTGIDTLHSPERFKDIQHIDYSSRLNMIGTQYTYQNIHFYYQSTFVASGRKDMRIENTKPYFLQSTGIDHNDNQKVDNNILSFHNQLIWKRNSLQYHAGFRSNAHINHSITNDLAASKSYFSLYPYIQMSKKISNSLGYTIGSGLMYDTYSNELTFEPSVSIDIKPFNRFEINAVFRRSSIQDFSDVRFIVGSYNPVRIKSGNYQLSGQYIFNNLKVALTGFYHGLYDIATFRNDSIPGSFGSTFNGGNLGFDQLLIPFWIPNGTNKAKVYGGDIYFQKRLLNHHNSWFFDFNVSIFSSKYRQGNLNENYYHGRFDYGYVSNISISYEKKIVNTDKSSKWMASIALHNRGGQRDPELQAGNVQSPLDLYKYNEAFTYQAPGFMRIDGRLVYSKKKINSNLRHVLSVDLQNMLNMTNFGYRYYDFLLDKVMIQNQLGLVPVLSYRLVFE